MAIATRLLEAVINASPLATILVDTGGQIICLNQTARRLFHSAVEGGSLLKVVGGADSLLDSLARSCRSSATVPMVLRQASSDSALRAQLRPLALAPGERPRHVLITLQNRQDANHNMLELKQQLHRSNIERSQLLRQNEELRSTVEVAIPRLEALSFTDGLTGLGNRRMFDQRFAKEWRRALRDHDPLSLLYLDLDRFKDYNDHYGHPQGDKCLRRVATALDGSICREFDVACRIGGEEFAVLLPMTDEAGASKVAERILSCIRALQIPHPHPRHKIVSISIGAGTIRPAMGTAPEDFTCAVDAALYGAKRGGRDCIETMTQETTRVSCSHDGAGSCQ